eukprot:565083_1
MAVKYLMLHYFHLAFCSQPPLCIYSVMRIKAYPILHCQISHGHISYVDYHFTYYIFLNVSSSTFFAHNEHEHDDTPQHPKGELNTPLTFERIDPRVDSFRLRQSGSRTRSIFEDPLFDDHGEDILRLMKQKNSLSGFVLLLGLGLHSFLAGMGFGSSDDMTQAFALAIAILAHKYLAAFALGCPFFQSGVPLKQHIMIAVIFSIITPSGIGIGWALSDEFDSWVSDIFVSIAAGTFIYVALIEILVPEF